MHKEQMKSIVTLTFIKYMYVANFVNTPQCSTWSQWTANVWTLNLLYFTLILGLEAILFSQSQDCISSLKYTKAHFSWCAQQTFHWLAPRMFFHSVFPMFIVFKLCCLYWSSQDSFWRLRIVQHRRGSGI